MPPLPSSAPSDDPAGLLRTVYRVFAGRYLAATASLAYYPGRWLALRASEASRANAPALLDEEPLAALAAGMVDDALGGEPPAASGPDFERAFVRFRQRAQALARSDEPLVFVRIGRHALAPSDAAMRRARVAGSQPPVVHELLSVLVEASGFDTAVAGGVVLAPGGLPEEVMPAMPIPVARPGR